MMTHSPVSFKNVETLPIHETLSHQLEACLKHHKRKCPGLTDIEFILACVKRVITLNQSGRDFLQFLHDVFNSHVPRSTFFDALKSKRRCRAVKEMSALYHDLLSAGLTGRGIDNLSAFPELNEFDIFAADGHFIEHPSHLKKMSDQRIYAPGNIYMKNIRNGLVQLLTPVTDGTSKAHELPHFRKAIESMNTMVKLIWIVDRAYVDYAWWEKQKKRGHLVISRTKSNMSPIYCGERPFDADDPVNQGVVRDRTGGFSNSSAMVRIIDYVHPETGEEMTFYTTLGNNLRPGLICWLYFLRWNIEKAFDCFKNALGEKKAWATGLNALQIQGHSIGIIYNFIRFLSETVQKENQTSDKKAEKKYRDHLDKRSKIAEAQHRFVHPLLYLYRPISRISAQIVRLIRNHFFSPKPLRELIPCFIHRLEWYL